MRRRTGLLVGGWLLLVLLFVALLWWRSERTTYAAATLFGYEAQGSALTVVYEVGEGEGCAEPAGVQVDERADRVVVSARVRNVTRGGGTVCPLVARHHRETVPLRAPLGSRQVVDGDGRPVPSLGGPTPSPLPNA